MGEDVELNPRVPEGATRTPFFLDLTTFFLWRQ